MTPSLLSQPIHLLLAALLLFLTKTPFSSAHTVIVYPGWRGDNLIANCTIRADDYKTGCFPYGMQWMYPCGGMPLTTNRTFWPTTGGALSFQPGWFSGHSSALIYINLGLGAIPPNYSHPMLPVFEIEGPSNDAFPTLDVCLPQVPLPSGVSVAEGDLGTIQVVEAAKHGAALFSCVDIIFTNDMSKVNEVNASNCVNATELSFSQVFTTRSLTSGAGRAKEAMGWASMVLALAAIVCVLIE